MISKRAHQRSGFTLIEVLMVAAILALLAAFAVPALMGAGDEAKKNIVRATIGRNGSIASGLKQFRFDVGRYPDTDEGLEALYERPNAIDEDSGLWKRPYMETPLAELRDVWHSEYKYRSPGEFNEESYDLWSVGPDLKDGTDDDIKNWTER